MKVPYEKRGGVSISFNCERDWEAKIGFQGYIRKIAVWVVEGSWRRARSQ
jgi:hypothetical protein